jgi:hypothetical protein
MHIYDESTSRRTIWSVQINWSKELTFSERQIRFIAENVPESRGVYCIYAKDRKFRFSCDDRPTDRWSRVVYIGSGWLNQRLCAHLYERRNNLLAHYLDTHRLAFRCDRIADTDTTDWPKTVEAYLLQEFEAKFGALPCANRRRETIPDLSLDLFILKQQYFNFLARG